MPTNPIAVQMYTLRDQVDVDITGALRAVAELGYGAVELELKRLGGWSPAALRSEIEALGLRVTSAHVALDDLENRRDEALAGVLALGARYVVCPWLPPERRGNAEKYQALARTLNQIGQDCRARSLQLCYHHHDFEFARFGQTTGLDILFGETDPALVQAEIDVYWVAFAHHDPIAIIRGMAGRVPLIHLKDMAADPSRSFAEVGYGVLDLPAILAACDESAVEWLIVEQDRCERPPLESVGMSLKYLRSLGRA